MTLFLICYAALIGLCVGSFLNVVILRGLSGESIVLPPSHCTKCNHKLAWYDNIPLFSYLILRGKCRYCSEKISIQYPLVEFFTALTFVGLYLKYGITLNTLFLLIASSLCIVMAMTDIKEKVILDGHAYWLMALGLVYNFFNIANENNTRISLWAFGAKISIYQTFIHSILGLVLGFGAMSALAWVVKIILKRDGFGEGDSYILGALGSFWGITNAIVIFMLSIFIWGGAAIPVFLYKWFKEKKYKLFYSVILFFVSAILFLLGEKLNIFSSSMFQWFAFLLVASTGFYSCKEIISSMKNNQNGLTVIPFGPALVFGAFVVMFVL